MELPGPTLQALWVLYVLERTVLRCKQKWVSYQVFKMVGAWIISCRQLAIVHKIISCTVEVKFLF